MSFNPKRIVIFVLLIGVAAAGIGVSPNVVKHAIKIFASAIWGS